MEKNYINCHLDLPYPPVEVCAENPQYACLLSRDLAGAGGEMTAVCQYLYQHTITHSCSDELSAALECISQVEMHHMHILMELIEMLGGDPKYVSHTSTCSSEWSAGFVSYDKNMRRFLCANIEAEKKAIATYKKRICQISDPKVRAMLQRIILDEEYHIRIFQCFLSKLA